MGKIYAEHNVKTNDWSLNTDELTPFHNELFISFIKQQPTIVYKDLKFGFELKQNDNIKKYGVYPPPGVRYKKSDQSHLVSVTLELKDREKYTLDLWCEHNGIKSNKEFILSF